jgi:hypothetical protein
MLIWFTRGLSVTTDAITTARFDPALKGATFMASHYDLNAVVSIAADIFIVEPKELHGAAYAAWALEQAAAHKVDMIICQNHIKAMWTAKDSFEAWGIKLVLAAAPDIIEMLDDKEAFQSDLMDPALAMAGVAGHDYRTFDDLASFETAWAELNDSHTARHGLCIKPVRGIFGSGFRRIDTDGEDLHRMLSSDASDMYRMSLAALRASLTTAKTCPKMLLMPFLPGLERSVDFACKDGEILLAVARRKEGYDRILETEGPSIEMTRILAKRYRLNGICNLQTRECDGRELILEINPRMAGGMAQSFTVGVNLSGASLSAALGKPVGTPNVMGETVTLPRKLDLVMDPHIRVIHADSNGMPMMPKAMTPTVVN